MKKIIIAPDSFKGTLSAKEVADIIAQSTKKSYPSAQIVTLPIADGGEGSLDCFASAKGGERIKAKAHNIFMEEIEAEYLLLNGGKVAVIEVAKILGVNAEGNRREVFRATSYGVGDLISDALSREVKEIILTLGGSLTNDGGVGMAVSLGAKAYDKDGELFVPVGGTLQDIWKIDMSSLDARISQTKFTAICDVDAPIIGKKGATIIFSPQKGASHSMISIMEDGMTSLVNIIEKSKGENLKEMPKGGAAGGLGFGSYVFLGAELKAGIDVILEMVRFDELIEDANLVITGEGILDKQSLMGKVINGISERTMKMGIPLIVLTGINELSEQSLKKAGITRVFETNPHQLPFETIKYTAKEDLERAADEMFTYV